MKKRYIFTLELETQVGEKISMADEKKNRYFNELLTEVLKNNNILRDLYWLFMMSFINEESHLYDMEEDIYNLKEKNEIEMIRPALPSLSAEAKLFFQKLFEKNNKQTDEFYEVFFTPFGNLALKKATFIEKGEKQEPDI